MFTLGHQFELFHDKNALKRVPAKTPVQTLCLDDLIAEKHHLEKTEPLFGMRTIYNSVSYIKVIDEDSKYRSDFQSLL